MLRRLLILTVCFVGLLAVALAVLPWWLGPVLKLAGRSHGLDFASYERVGYSRFSLTDARYVGNGIQVTVARVEADTPAVWLFHRWTGNARPIIATEWQVEMEPRTAEDPAPSANGRLLGAMDLQRMLVELVHQVDPWVPQAETGPGSVQWEGGGLHVAAVVWKDSSLTVDGLRSGGFTGDVILEFPEVAEARVRGNLSEGNGQFAITLREGELTGEIRAWDQVASLSAKFVEDGWLPETAKLVAENWEVPAGNLGLGASYSAVRGTARIEWHGGGLKAVIDAEGEPVADSGAPPLSVRVRAHGDTESLFVESLHIVVPGVKAELSEPVEIDWHGQMKSGPSVFTLAVNVKEQPWFDGEGELTGEARLTPRDDAIPLIEAKLEGSEFVWREWKSPAGAVQAVLDWPSLKISAATSGKDGGDKLEANGTLNLETNELTEGTASGDFNSALVQQWLPAGVAFASASFAINAQGPLDALKHEGTFKAVELQLPSLHPVEFDMTWSGTGATAEIPEARIHTGTSDITLSATVDAQEAKISSLQLLQGGELRLSLESPATVRWSPAIELSLFKLVGPDGSLAFSSAWGRSGRVELSAQHINPRWLADFADTPELDLEIASLEMHGEWDDGPLKFTMDASLSMSLGEDFLADVAISASGDGDGLVVNNVQVTKKEGPILTIQGELPVTVHPMTSQFVRIEQKGPVKFNATTVASPVFWQTFKELTGLELIDPDLKVELDGTWAEPRGEIHATATRVAADLGKLAFPLPRIEALELQASADGKTLSLERFSMQVEGQLVRATGQVRLGPKGWKELLTEPLTVIQQAVELHLEIPDAEIAGLHAYTAPYLAPEGRLTLDATLKEGGEIEGKLGLRGATTRPLGPLGILQEISADVVFSGRTAELQNVSATAGGQPVTLTGKVEMPRNGPPEFNLSLKGSNLPFVRQTGLLLRGDLDLKLTTGPDGVPLISGGAQLRDSLFLSDLRALLPRGGRGVSRRPPYFGVETAPLNTWRLAVDVLGDRFLRVRTALFNGIISAKFRLSGTLGDPRATGESTVEGGKVLLPFATFDVQQGSVRLTQAEPFEPALMLVGISRLYGYDLRMELAGTASDPALTLTSSPSLGADELLGMVMAGEPPRSQETLGGGNRFARLGTYLRQGFLKNYGNDAGDPDRLVLTTGENISRLGRETYGIEYKLGGRFSLAGEYDEFDAFNAGVKWRFFSDKRKPEPETTVASADRVAGIPAKISISGLGWLGDWEQTRSLRRLLGDQWGPTLSTNAIEDASILLLSAVNDEGYLQASLEMELTTEDGTARKFTFDSSLSTTLPRPLAVTEAKFHLTKGVRNFVEEVKITGLTAIPEKVARGYFRPEGVLIGSAAERAYTPARFAQAMDRLQDELRQHGFAEAEVQEGEVLIGDETGKVSLAIAVVEGPRWQVTSLQFTGAEDLAEPLAKLDKFASQPWSRSWQQDVKESVRRVLFEHGYPDVNVKLAPAADAVESGMKPVVVTVAIDPGQPVRVGEVRFEGNERTKESVLRRAVVARTGDPLDPLVLERARHRLSRLGIFESVELNLDPPDGAVRDPVFLLKEGQRWEGNLLFGYGSYEQLRVGASIRQLNLFGLAHQSRLDLGQSIKSSRAEYSYTVPELFGESVDGTTRIFGLQRQETSFIRTEFGVNVSLRHRIEWLSGETSIGYTFQSLRNRDNELGTAPLDNPDILVGSVDASLSSDKRDNPLRPHRGYRWFGRIETAARNLGGETDYQRLIFGGSYHTAFGSGRWIHAGLVHGVITTFGANNDLLLPVNKRFFPGGDGSIRGYQSGEASPRDATGKFVGAKSYVQANLEIEQALTGSWSAVIFVDAVGVAARLADYPFNETLFSVGAGIRYQTLIGPIRLEYGHNLNPRELDPGGTLHVSVGFPF